ncbi:hypothetical protein T06_1568 [Trichinella sp. T6]|nr:hypothetical protein T06_1568 [Trichinella sp. T6]
MASLIELLSASGRTGILNSTFTSSVKQRDCGKLAAASALYHFAPNCSVDIKSSCKVLRSYLVAPFSAMSRGVSWSPVIPVVYIPSMNKQYSNQILNYLEHFPFASINMEPQHKMAVNVSIPLSDFSSYVPNNVENDDDTLIVDYIATIVTVETGIKPCPAVPACFHKVNEIASDELNTAVGFHHHQFHHRKGIHEHVGELQFNGQSLRFCAYCLVADRKDTNVAEAKTFRPTTLLMHPGRSGYD